MVGYIVYQPKALTQKVLCYSVMLHGIIYNRCVCDIALYLLFLSHLKAHAVNTRDIH